MHDRPQGAVRVFPDLERLSRGVAEALVSLARAGVAARGGYRIALAGGSTPTTLYRLLATEFRDQVPWSQVHCFWGDERYVPPADPRSNAGRARAALLDHLPIPASQVHPMETDHPDPATAARAYEAVLRQHLPDRGPAFDLTLLGLGSDGHTASLFPGTPALEEGERRVVATRVPADPPDRLTLTLPLLNRSRVVFFLVSGAAKGPAVAAILRDRDAAAARYPAARIRPRERLCWFLDAAAAPGGP